MKAAAIVCGLILGLTCAFLVRENYILTKENITLEHVNKIADGRSKIQDEQIQDMQFEISSRRTYEDGFRDGVLRSESGEYMAGYHAAMTQQEEMRQYQQKLAVEEVK